jgi:hypothetical protein
LKQAFPGNERDASFIYYRILDAVNFSDWGAAAQGSMMGIVTNMIGQGMLQVGDFNTAWGQTLDDGTVQLVESFFFGGGRKSGRTHSFDELRTTLAHEFQHRGLRLSGVPQPELGTPEWQAEENMAICRAVRITGYVSPHGLQCVRSAGGVEL